MKVIVPYTKLHEDTRTALIMDEVEADYRLMEDDTAYARLLEELWDAGETFIIVEHDMIPWPGALTQLWECPEDWCGFVYKLSYQGSFSTALGCTKFGVSLIASIPDLFEMVREKRHYWYPGDPMGFWGLDGRIFGTLGAVLGKPAAHAHWPPVTHLNLAHKRR